MRIIPKEAGDGAAKEVTSEIEESKVSSAGLIDEQEDTLR